MRYNDINRERHFLNGISLRAARNELQGNFILTVMLRHIERNHTYMFPKKHQGGIIALKFSFAI